MGDLNDSDICWENNMVGCKQSVTLLESIEGNFLVQVLDKITRGEVLLDLVLTNAMTSLKKLRFEALWAVKMML